MKATVIPNEFEVEHAVQSDREFISFDIPNGWDDVKKISKKILLYDNRKFKFSCWNSDTMKCHFMRLLDRNIKTAKII
jgi:hypothetical protein